MLLRVYGVIGDCPAIKVILNHISHVGYNCCWYCNIKGEHVNGKRQYYYRERLEMRKPDQFLADSITAENRKENINGRLGLSMLNSIVDIPLPKSVIADYLHVTLLRHAKAVFHYLYFKKMKRKQRLELDRQMINQRFPHFFNRTIKPLKEPFQKYAILRLNY